MNRRMTDAYKPDFRFRHTLAQSDAAVAIISPLSWPFASFAYFAFHNFTSAAILPRGVNSCR
jgi:hypothetical protein